VLLAWCRRLMQDNRLAVEEAHRRFYDAFKISDQKVRPFPLRCCCGVLGESLVRAVFQSLQLIARYMELLNQPALCQAMDAIWGDGEHIQCIHPGGNCIAGRKSVSPPIFSCLKAKIWVGTC
jgi:hypothetical protein